MIIIGEKKQFAIMWLKRFSMGEEKGGRKIIKQFRLKQYFLYFIVKDYWPWVSFVRLF